MSISYHHELDDMKEQYADNEDHDGLVAEHLRHAQGTLAHLLAHMFNRAVCDGFPESWSTNTILPIFKAGI